MLWIRVFLSVLLLAASFALAASAQAGDPRRVAGGPDVGPDVGPAVDIDAFFGTFVGQASAGIGAEAATRDLSVTIAPASDRGFVVDWTTKVRAADGHDTRKSYSIAFMPTQRPGIYRSAMRANVFGQMVPLDPFTGDPLVWARLSGRTLSVFALIILSDGGYDMQVYDRTLSETGLDLVFTRWIDREQVAKVTGTLVRAPD